MTEISQTESELLSYINDTPRLMSLLYDINLLPEQTMDSRHWRKTLIIAEQWRANNETLNITK